MMDGQMRRQVVLDAVVTVVDAKHLLASHCASPEVDDQIAFADVIVMNKADLVSRDGYDDAVRQVRRLNPAAELQYATRADVAPAMLFGKRAFGFDRTLPDGGDQASQHRHGAGVGAVSLTADEPLDVERLHRGNVTL